MSTLKRAGNVLTEQDKTDIRRDIGLGTSAQLDVPSSDNATSGQVVKGSDTRLSDARTPTAHTHTASAISDFSSAADARIAAASINALADVAVTSPSAGQVLKWGGSAWVNDTDAGGAGATNLTYTASPTGGTVNSDTGTDASVPLSDGTNAGLMDPAQHAKLAGIATSATANATDAQLRDRSTHTGTQSAATITGLATVATTGAYADLTGKPTLGTAAATDASAYATAAQGTDSREWSAATVTQAEAEAGTDTARKAWTVLRVWQAVAAWWAASAMKTKLDGIASGATANATDAQLRDRSTHTGTQAFSTLTMATARLLGRATAGSGAAEEIAIGSGLTLSAGTLSASGGGGSPGGSSGQVQYNNAGAFGGAANVSVVSTGGGTSNCLAVGDSGAHPGFVSVRGSPSSNGPHGLRFWSATDAVAVVGYDQGTTRKAGIGFLDFGQTTLRMAVTCTNGDLKTEFGGPVYPKQYTTATRPAWVNGAVIFDTDIDKLVIGGASAWEVVTSA